MHWYTVSRLMERDIPGDLMAGALPSSAGGVGSIPDQGAKNPHASSQDGEPPQMSGSGKASPRVCLSWARKELETFRLWE